MRLIYIQILAFIFPFFGTAQFDTLFLPNKINLLTVAVDYEDYSFSGASLNYYDCEDCTLDSLPFGTNYVVPGDFGSMSLYLNPSMEVFFSGTIVWMGLGQQTHPQLSSNTAPPYDVLPNSLAVPSFMSYLDMNGAPIASNSQTDLAWQTASSLQIVQLIAANDYDVLCYLYAPTVGMFDPGPAKWFFFFYKNNFSAELSENELLDVNVYPNPAEDHLFIHHELSEQLTYKVMNMYGAVVSSGQLVGNQISIDQLEAGVYLLELNNLNGKGKKVKWFKR